MHQHSFHPITALPFTALEERPWPWKYWLRLTAPARTAQTCATSALRQQMRRAEYVSYILLVLFCSLLLNFLVASFVSLRPPNLFSLGINFLVDLLYASAVAFFNRRRKILIAANILIGFSTVVNIVGIHLSGERHSQHRPPHLAELASSAFTRARRRRP